MSSSARSTAALRPRFRDADAVRIARAVFGLAATAEPLPSERDQNFKMTAGPDACFVLKISRSSERPEELDLQNQAFDWLATRDATLPVPRLQTTTAGAKLEQVRSPDGSSHLVRLLSYLPGVVLARTTPHSPSLLRSLGRFLGRLDRALQGFSHPASLGRDLDWDPRRALTVIARHREAIPDAARRAQLDGFVDRFQSTATPLLSSLRTSVIQNDANDYNVLVNAPATRDRQVVGLVDFGDMVETWTVQELAVAVAYAILGKADPLTAAAAVVGGYHEALPLEEPELEVLAHLVPLRLCTSVCLSARRRTEEPDNEYLTISEAPAWKSLQALSSLHPRLLRDSFRDACALSPCPRAPRLVTWLREQQGRFAPVVKTDLAKAVVFDLSVGSPEFESPAEAADTRRLGEKLDGLMKAAGAEAGLGRYDEARLVYTSDAFRASAGEWRTVHLGVDIFMAAGTAVHAPLAGRVHSFADNAARLDYGPTLLLEHAGPGAPFFTLYGHLSEDSLAGLQPGTPVVKGQQIARIGSPPRNGDWPPHLHFQIVSDLLDRKGEFPGVAAPSQRSLFTSLSPDPSLILGLPKHPGDAPRDPAALVDARRRRLGPSLSLAYRSPLKIVRGFGSRLYDHTGGEFLDVVNNVAHVGHCHPRVVRAAQRQLAVLNTNTRYLHDHIVRYAERLTATLPEPLRVCFFVCSGSEANELALRLARAHTKARDVIVVEGAYHGNTSGLVDVSPYKFDGPGGAGAPAHVHKIPMPDDYRGRHRRHEPARGEAFAATVAAAAEALAQRGDRAAAFLCESLLSCGGQIVLPPGFLEASYRHARAAGAVCIADEVQVGFGRVGSHFWGFETQHVVPDIVTMGKPIGNGHPLAAVVTTPEIAASFANGMEYFNTFGGNPVACAIGMAVLDVIADEGLQAHALEVGGRFQAGLARLAERHLVLGDVRGLGLFLGIELVRDRTSREPAAEQAAYVVERMREQGILLSTDGPLHNVIKMKPPLVFSAEDAERVVRLLDLVLAEDFVREAASPGAC